MAGDKLIAPSLAGYQVRLAEESDVPALRCLVNAAYRQLADMGLNYTGTYQDEAITRRRMVGREVVVVCGQQQLLGTISLEVRQLPEWDVLYISQFAVSPVHQRQGIGQGLLALAEQRASELGLAALRLDTAVPATHLVALYQRCGYQVIEEVHWPDKTYNSYILEKRLV